jgi:hypothetical protein
MKLTRPSDDPLTNAVALPTRSGIAKPPLAMASTLGSSTRHLDPADAVAVARGSISPP